jgi:hypothetical protein
MVGSQADPLLRLSCATMTLLALTKLGSESYRLLWEPCAEGAIDLKLRWQFTVSWFSGVPVYELFATANDPPATAALLWPLQGWLDFTGARVLWAVTSLLALVWLTWLVVRHSGANSRLEAAFAALMMLSMNALGVTIGNGQLGLHILPPLLTAVLLLKQARRGWATDLLVTSLLVCGRVCCSPSPWAQCSFLRGCALPLPRGHGLSRSDMCLCGWPC